MSATATPSKGKGFQDPRYRALIEKLVEERKRLGLNQTQLAERLGRHQQFVSRYETGERRLDVVEFADVAKTMGLPLFGLFNEL